jgi:glycosyltransferase involved in cell wall biosynthesis
MRILHCCLANFYVDNYSYQENILPKMHKLQGHEVRIVASTETYNSKLRLEYVKPSSYVNEVGIRVSRLSYSKLLPHFISKKLRIYRGLRNELIEFKPSIIFMHDCQFLSILTIRRYKRENTEVRLFVDGHTDLINSARNWVSRNVLHKIIYKYCAKSIENYTEKFWGVLPLRADFFVDFYGISRSKVGVLNFGFDDSIIDLTKKKEIRREVRKNLGILEDDFVFITGGKIDKRKNIDLVIKSFAELNETNAKLIIFGRPNSETNEIIEQLINQTSNIRFLGWLNNVDTSKYLIASDLAIYPGTHSTLWEMTLGLGTPCLFKKWDGMDHLRISDEIDFLYQDNKMEIVSWMKKCMLDRMFYQDLKEKIEAVGNMRFKYSEIAKKAIE